MELLGNVTFLHRTIANDDVKAENARISIVAFQLQGGAINEKNACLLSVTRGGTSSGSFPGFGLR